jgi:RNA polymerase sigma-70 factor (ECF subfamily)
MTTTTLNLPLPSPQHAERALQEVLARVTRKPLARRNTESKRARRLELDAMSDVDLLETVCKGDEIAWEAFYDRFRNLMIACITRVCLRAGVRVQSDDLMDILGDACMNMVAGDFRRLKLYRVDGGCSVSSWIGVIATSTAHDHLRRERRRRLDPMAEADLERLAPTVDGPDAELIDRQQRAFVDVALSGLSKRDRKFAELYFGEAKSPDDIAKEMGVSVSTVYSKKAKIKTRLQSLAKAAA